MIRYIITRLLLVFVNLFILSTILFFALNFAQMGRWNNLSFEELRPIIFRLYKNFVEQRILDQNWGLTGSGDPVLDVIVPRFWITVKYNLISFGIYVPVGILIGIISAYYKDGFFDKIVNTFILVFGSVPIYILIALLIPLFGFQLHWFPAKFSVIPDTTWGRIWGLGIPIIALTAGAISKISRIIRDEMVDALHSEYYLLARTKGLTKLQAMMRHTFRNCMTSLLPIMMDVFIFVLMGSFFVEIAFGIDGVASLMYRSMMQLDPDIGFAWINIDVNTIIVISTFYMFVGFTFSLLVDIVIPLVDPRIKIHSTKKKHV
jgi:oligopeptide transport system permease protein